MTENIALAAAQSAAASASSAATSAEYAASIIAEPNDAAVSTLVNTPASSTAVALAATFVRFEDLAGNPLAAGTVVIKIDTANGNEVNDIIWEA